MISTCPPYSYSKLINFLTDSLVIAEKRGIGMKMKSLCKSLGGVHIPYLIISKDRDKYDVSK